ncbi:hypothetical protein WME89_00820 [Sorangium sp. So ce321]|uniref:hypothetical protein n=1 Tax=Sorangium sp. So ce321 TaxID=3133300 RepID=UPI003F5E34AD
MRLLVLRHLVTLLLVATSLFLTACAGRARVPRTMPVAPITATAPRGIDDRVLGAPVDAHFRPLQGTIGRSLFESAAIARLPQSYVSHDIVTMRDTAQLEANLAAWAIVDTSLGYASENRYGTYRAFQVVHVSAIDDTSEMEDPPIEAAFYIAKVYWGYSYEAVFEGDRRQFNTGVSARMATFEGDVDAFAASSGLRLHFVGTGLRPRTPTAIFARGPEAILSAYDTATAPSPIFVEYRAIPGRWSRTTSPIPFDAALRIAVRFENVRVIEDGTWFSTPWNLSARCRMTNAYGSGPVSLLAGDSVDSGQTYSLNRTIDLIDAPGGALECTAEGSYADAIGHGKIAPGRSPSVQLVGPGQFPLRISGNGGTSYVINASVDVSVVN